MAIKKIKLPNDTTEDINDSRLPVVTATDNGKLLGVNGGIWSKITKPGYTLDEVSDGSTRKLANYLPLTGGTISGELEFSHTIANAASIKFTNTRATSTASNWGDIVLNIVDADGTAMSRMGIYGSQNNLSYLYIGSNAASGDNLRISSTALTWGDNTIWHAGNFVAGTNYQAPMSQGTGITVSNNQISVNSTYQGYITHGESAYNSLGNYVLKAGDTMTGLLLLNYANARIGFQNGSGTTLGVLGVRSAGTLEFFDMAMWRTVYHSNNSNKSDVPWACSSLTATGTITHQNGTPVRKITISSSEPTSSDGSNGDIWIVV